MQSLEFTGILDIDCPDLTDAEIREIETGDPETTMLPNGDTVSVYARKVAALKEARLKEVFNSAPAEVEAFEPLPDPVKKQKNKI